ncbi:MAG: DNA polymerase domain-containing protein [Sandaracinus sp.]
MASKSEKITLRIGERDVSISSPSKVYFPEAGVTKLDVVQYYLAVAEGALRGAGGRPNVLVRYVEGIGEPGFFQKRAPDHRPDWLEVVALKFPSGRTAEELVPREPAALAWMANLGCLELHPHPVRAEDLDHPDELRVDLDPVPGVEWPQIRDVAGVVREVLADLGMVGWPKTSGSRGIHVVIRIEPRWGFSEVRRAALAFAREVERRAPTIATSKWWKEERHGVFLDYNQNAKDRTVASAYSVRPKPDARVSAPLTWEELAECRPEDFTLRTMPARFAAIGDRHAEIDAHPCSIEKLLEMSARDEREGLGDAPWPPHYQKQEGEPARVQPSRARKEGAEPRPRAPRKPWTPPMPRAPGELPPKSRRKSTKPVIEIARAERKEDAVAGLERWKAKHADVVPFLAPADVLTDAMRGRYTAWWRIRVNLEHVPEEKRPAQEALEVDYEPGDIRPVNAGGASKKRASETEPAADERPASERDEE